MPVNIATLELYRIIPLTNLEAILEHGVFCKNDKTIDSTIFVSIGNREVIEQRGRAVVKCYPDTYVNDYVPFYFSVRTPMLFNIKTGWGVPKYPQENIVYLCYSMSDLATENYQWLLYGWKRG
ncbi:MAG: DarT ssDNA thymidine ADP-ribosyltransferase family protein [Agriterribacter sp.]